MVVFFKGIGCECGFLRGEYKSCDYCVCYYFICGK